MPGGLILWVLIASHQYSTISRWQGLGEGRLELGGLELLVVALERGWRMSQLLAHMVHQKLNQVLFIDMRRRSPT